MKISGIVVNRSSNDGGGGTLDFRSILVSVLSNKPSHGSCAAFPNLSLSFLSVWVKIPNISEPFTIFHLQVKLDWSFSLVGSFLNRLWSKYFSDDKCRLIVVNAVQPSLPSVSEFQFRYLKVALFPSSTSFLPLAIVVSPTRSSSIIIPAKITDCKIPLTERNAWEYVTFERAIFFRFGIFARLRIRK